jgi:hypothetical protein
MDELSTDVAQYILNFIPESANLVSFQRSFKTGATAVDAKYWRTRVYQLLGLPLVSAGDVGDIPWSKAGNTQRQDNR